MLTTELKRTLQSTKLCRELDEQELDLLLAHSKIMSFANGQYILRQGQSSDGVYLILDGTVTVTAKVLGESIATITTLTAGDFIGEISMIEREPCATSAMASDKLECLFINNLYFDMLTVFNPQTKYKIFRTISFEICERLKKLHAKITSIMSESNMATTRSLFSDLIQSLTKPSAITYEEAGIDVNKLKESPLFSLFTNDELNELLKHATPVKAAKQCTLIHEHEGKLPCYIILHGAVQSSIVHENKVAKLYVLGPVTLFTSITSIEDEAVSIMNYTTCERAVLLEISGEALEFLHKYHIQLWYKLFDLICASLAALERSADKLEIRLNSELYNR